MVDNKNAHRRTNFLQQIVHEFAEDYARRNDGRAPTERQVKTRTGVSLERCHFYLSEWKAHRDKKGA